MSNYDSDECIPRSPGLEAVKVKYVPSPSPPPFPQRQPPAIPQNVSSAPQRRSKRPNRTRPSQGDTVLISFLDPNRPDIARAAGETALNSASQSEASDCSDDDMNERRDSAPRDVLSTIAQKAQALGNSWDVRRGGEKKDMSIRVVTESVRRDPDVDMEDDISPKTVESRHASMNAGQHGRTQLAHGLPTPEGYISKSSVDATTSPGNFQDDDSLATSPNLRELTIPQSQGSPDQTLPALQNPTSPGQENPNASPKQTLPSFQSISKIADDAKTEHARAHAYRSHRQSISSAGALSPTLHGKQLLNGQRRPSPPPFAPPGPISPAQSHGPSPASSTEQYRTVLSPPGTTPSTTASYFYSRRPSQASEHGPLYPSSRMASGSTEQSYSTSESYSPGSTPVEAHRISIDGIAQPPQISHIPPHGASGFKCDHPGCTAPPFQTQYLLNSHANVHSQSRPHYCPVPGCARGEGGKGFKRKNEMIRHGLVHDSPGYVCPFCPERDHKYPRPDNLQRHVRVHHIDKDKDDALLRDVLAQRPEGGGRGRRRRMGV